MAGTQQPEADVEDFRVFCFSLIEAALVLEHHGKVVPSAKGGGVIITGHCALNRDNRPVLRLRSRALAAESQQISRSVAGVQGVWIVISQRATADAEDFRVFCFSLIEAALVLEHDGKVVASAKHGWMLFSRRRALQSDDGAVFSLRRRVVTSETQHVGHSMPSGQGIGVFFA